MRTWSSSSSSSFTTTRRSRRWRTPRSSRMTPSSTPQCSRDQRRWQSYSSGFRTIETKSSITETSLTIQTKVGVRCYLVVFIFHYLMPVLCTDFLPSLSLNPFKKWSCKSSFRKGLLKRSAILNIRSLVAIDWNNPTRLLKIKMLDTKFCESFVNILIRFICLVNSSIFSRSPENQP